MLKVKTSDWIIFKMQLLVGSTHKYKNTEKWKVSGWQKINWSYQAKRKMVIHYQTKQTKLKSRIH